MFVWFHALFSHFCVTEKGCLRVVGECCDEFVEEASVGGVVDGVEEKQKRGTSNRREWRALDEFGEEKGVVE